MGVYPASSLFPSPKLFPSGTVWPGLPDVPPPTPVPGPYTPRPFLEITWHPPHGREPIQFGVFPPFVLRSLTGLADVGGDDVWSGALGQWGASLVASGVLPRTVALVVTAVAETERGLPAVRRRLADAFARRPNRPGTVPPLGTLEVMDINGHRFEIGAACSIRNETREGQTATTYEVDVTAPDPRWRSVDERHVKLQAGVGLSGPIDGPIHSIGNTLTASVSNPGSVPSPLMVRIRGPVTGATVELVETGQKIKVRDGVTIEDGQTLWVNTAFVGRSVTLDGERAAAMLDMAETDFFFLPPGASTVRFEGMEDTGSALLSWHPHWAGL